jgi:regulator of replication initiation timing
MAHTHTITEERAARRFHQMAVLEQQLQIKHTEIAECKEHLKGLGEERAGLILRLRAAARNEGELPLFDLDA